MTGNQGERLVMARSQEESCCCRSASQSSEREGGLLGAAPMTVCQSIDAAGSNFSPIVEINEANSYRKYHGTQHSLFVVYCAYILPVPPSSARSSHN